MKDLNQINLENKFLKNVISKYVIFGLSAVICIGCESSARPRGRDQITMEPPVRTSVPISDENQNPTGAANSSKNKDPKKGLPRNGHGSKKDKHQHDKNKKNETQPTTTQSEEEKKKKDSDVTVTVVTGTANPLVSQGSVAAVTPTNKIPTVSQLPPDKGSESPENPSQKIPSQPVVPSDKDKTNAQAPDFQTDFQYRCIEQGTSRMIPCLENQKSLHSYLSENSLIDKLMNQFTAFKFDSNYVSDTEGDLIHLTVRFLYELLSGVAEGYRIGEHTERVLETYEQQKRFYKITGLNGAPYVTDHDVFMKYVIAYHDIGKGLAVRSGQKSREELFSHTIGDGFLTKSGFSEKEKLLGLTLIDLHQVIGQSLMGYEVTHFGSRQTYDTSQAIREIDKGALKCGLQGQAFFQYLQLLFIADAGSYDSLRGRIFTNMGGKLIPNNPIYSEFQRAFNQ